MLPSFTLQCIPRSLHGKSKAITVKPNSEEYDTLSGARSFGTLANKESKEIEMRQPGRSSIDVEGHMVWSVEHMSSKDFHDDRLRL